MEGAENEEKGKNEDKHMKEVDKRPKLDDDPGYKSFYAYFGRESKEANSKQSTNPNPPYYTPTNINLADLKGELSFFKNEFLPDSKAYDFNTGDFKNGRKYDIQYIDKWLLRYKNDKILDKYLKLS